jgi:hypothetical protein
MLLKKIGKEPNKKRLLKSVVGMSQEEMVFYYVNGFEFDVKTKSFVIIDVSFKESK